LHARVFTAAKDMPDDEETCQGNALRRAYELTIDARQAVARKAG